MRQEAIEAMAAKVATEHGDDWDAVTSSYRTHACDDMALALDALLEFLTEHVDEWVPSEWEFVTAIDAQKLLGVLR